MGLSEFSNDIKTKNTTVQQTVATSSVAQSAQVSTAKSSVIPVGQSTESNEILEKLKNSEEFKALSKEDKINVLKKHFPTALPEDIETILNNITAISNTTETAAEIKNDGKITIKEDEIFSKLYKIANDLKLSDQITMDQFNDLKNILVAIMKGEKVNLANISEKLKPFAQILDKIVPAEKLDQEKWNSLSATEKLNKRFDAFLDILISGYSGLEEVQKEDMRSKALDKITNMLFPDIQKEGMSEGTKQVALGTIAKIFEMAESKDVKISDFINNPNKAMVEVAESVLEEWVKSDEINYDSEEWKNASSDEQLQIIIKQLVKQLDPSITTEQLDNLKQSEILVILKPIGQKIFPEDWKDNETACLNSLTQKLAALNFAIKGGEAISSHDYLTNRRLQLEVLQEYEAQVTHPQLTDTQKSQRETFLHLSENASEEELAKLQQPTDIQIEAFILEQLKDKNLEPEKRKQYENTLKSIQDKKHILQVSGLTKNEIEEILKTPRPAVENTGAYEIGTKYYNKDTKTYDYEGYLNDQCKRLDKKTPSDLKAKEISDILNKIRDPQHAIEVGKLLGRKPEETLRLINDKALIQDILDQDNQGKYDIGTILGQHPNRFARKVGFGALSVSAKALHITSDKFAHDTQNYLIGDYAKENTKIVARIINNIGFAKEYISEITKIHLNNEQIDTEIKGSLVDSTIKFAPDDDTRNYYGKEWSNGIKDPNVLEYIGAASKYVEDPAKKSQYNSYVTEAAKSYPPETQARVQQAIETGNTSTTATQTKSAPKTEQKQPVQAPTAPKSSVVTTPTNTPEIAPTVVPNIVPTVSSNITQDKTSTVSTSSIDELNKKTTAALQQKKDSTLEHIEEHNAKVAADQAAREITDAEIEAFVDTIKEIETTEDTSKINQEKIKKFLNSNSVNVIYSKLVEKFGNAVIYKLINAVVAYGNSSKIDALASIIKSGSLMEELFAKCQSKRLLDKLQPSTVKRFIPYMNDLSAVRSDIMYEFIMDLINSNASVDVIKKYLLYLPFGMQVSICDTYNNLKGISLDSNITLTPNRKTEQSEQTQKEEDKTQVESNKPKPAIAANELTTVRNDGVEIKHKTSFAGISDKYDDEAYEVVDNKTGKTQSQREQVLTPGSYEWNLKYNKQAPKTAFTMAALDEEEDEGIGTFGSTKVGMGQKIKKKYPPQSFKYNA